MKYQFTISVDELQRVMSVYQRTGGYLEIIPKTDNYAVVISDNMKFLMHEDFENMERILKPAESHSVGIDVSEIKLQRTKRTEKKFLDFKLEKRRTKWELIKALQEEFDKFPDDTEFTSFFARGLGVGRSHYF